MAIEKKVIPVNLVGKLDTDTDPKINQQGLIRCENACFTRGGAISKRKGYYQLDETFAQDAYMATYNDKPVLFGNHVQLFEEIDGYPQFNLTDYITQTDISLNSVEMSGNHYVLQKSMAERGNIRVIAWIDIDTSGSIVHRVASYNIRTEQVIDTDTLTAYNFSVVRAIASSDEILVFYTDTNGYLCFGAFDDDGLFLGENTYTTQFPKVKATPLTRHLDTTTLSDGDKVMVSYVSDNSDSDGYVCVAGTNSLGVSDAYDVAFFDGYLTGIYRLDTSHAAVLMYGGDRGVNYEIAAGVWDNTITLDMDKLTLKTWADALQAPQSLVGISLDGTESVVYYEWNNSNYSYPSHEYSIRKANWTYNGTGVAGTLDAEALHLQGHYLCSKPFDDDTDIYIMVAPDVASGDTPLFKYCIYSDNDFFHGKTMVGDAWPSAPDAVRRIDTRSWRWVGITYRSDETMGLNIIDITKHISKNDIDAVNGLNTLVFPSNPSYEWDNKITHEKGFTNYPHRVDLSLIAYAGTPKVDVGVHSYSATYEWYDNQGNLHESAPAVVETIDVTTGNQKVDVKVPTYTITKKDNVSVVLWRTDVAGTILRRVDSTWNDPEAPYAQFYDTLPDSTLLSRAELYTTGGVFENTAPPPTRVSAIYQGRQFVVNREDEDRDIRYTKEFEPKKGISHCDSLTLYCPTEGGRITALKSFVDRLIIFKKNRIYATYGTGLVPKAGGGGGYAVPQLITPSVGCVNQKSIVEVPNGLMFVASDGLIYLLNRSLQVSQVGSAVKYWCESQTLSSAYVLERENNAVWLTTDGYALSYNWDYDRWSTWNNYEATDATIAGSDSVNGVAFFHTPDNKVKYQFKTSTNIYIEGVGWQGIPSTTIETGWFSFAGINGRIRVKRILLLMQLIGAHNLRVKIAYDFSPYWVDNYVMGFDEINYELYGHEVHFGDMTNNIYEDTAGIIEINPSRQKITSIRLQISDESITTGNGGFELSGAAFEVGINKGPYRVGSKRRDS